MERLEGQAYYCFLDVYSLYNQIRVDRNALWLVQFPRYYSKVHAFYIL